MAVRVTEKVLADDGLIVTDDNQVIKKEEAPEREESPETELQTIKERLWARKPRKIEFVMEDGRDYKRAQEIYAAPGYGVFQAWVDGMPDSLRTAYRYMNVVEVFGDFDCATLAQIDITALYDLASGVKAYADQHNLEITEAREVYTPYVKAMERLNIQGTGRKVSPTQVKRWVEEWEDRLQAEEDALNKLQQESDSDESETGEPETGEPETGEPETGDTLVGQKTKKKNGAAKKKKGKFGTVIPNNPPDESGEPIPPIGAGPQEDLEPDERTDNEKQRDWLNEMRGDWVTITDELSHFFSWDEIQQWLDERKQKGGDNNNDKTPKDWGEEI